MSSNCGLGGVLVELLRDVSFHLTPVTDVDARDMLGRLKAARLLDGYRGMPPGDRDALVDVILRVSALVEVVPELRELDLNPVKVLAPGRGAAIVDARLRVGRVGAIPTPRSPVSATNSPARGEGRDTVVVASSGWRHLEAAATRACSAPRRSSHALKVPRTILRELRQPKAWCRRPSSYQRIDRRTARRTPWLSSTAASRLAASRPRA